MAPFKLSGSRHPIVMVVDVTSNTDKFSGLLGTKNMEKWKRISNLVCFFFYLSFYGQMEEEKKNLQ